MPPSRADRADLLDEDAGGLASDVSLWSKRCRSCTSGGGGDVDDRPLQELVALDDGGEAIATLFVVVGFVSGCLRRQLLAATSVADR